MLIASKNGRKIRAINVDCLAVKPTWRSLNLVRGASGNVEDGTSTEQVAWFLEWHECHAPGRRGGSPTARVVGRRGQTRKGRGR
jgi:hypothetical protein